MKSFIAFLIISILLAIAGSAWGIYEFQAATGTKTAQTLSIIKSYLASLRPRATPKRPIIIEAPPEIKPPETPEAVKPPEEKPVPKKPLPAKPVKPAKVKANPLPAPKIETPPAKTKEEELIDAGNNYYDEGVVHLEKTFDKDDKFDRENDLAMEKFRQALDKYHEAEKTSPDDLWLRDRIRETNDFLIGCRKQARRK